MYEKLEHVMTHGSSSEIDAEAAKYGLVRAVSPDACEYCRAGVYVGYDHRECQTLVPPLERLGQAAR